MDETIRKKIEKIRRTIEQRPPNAVYIQVYWKDARDLCDIVDCHDRVLKKWARRLTRNGK